MTRRAWLHELAKVLTSALGGVATLAFAFAVLAAPMATPEKGVSPVAPAESARPGEATKLTVSGRIEAAQRDAAGKATAVQIAHPNGGRILIAQAGKGRELIGHVGKSATVTGRVVSRGGAKIMEVETYRLVQG